MSWRHSFRSKPMEALISCITADGPAAKRPPHCGFAATLPAVWRLAQGRVSSMALITRRSVLAAGGTLAAGLTARKPRAVVLA